MTLSRETHWHCHVITWWSLRIWHPRQQLYPFFWCKWYLVSSFQQICVGGWWRHNYVIMTSYSTKSVSFITWFLWCLFRVTFWIKQAFTKQRSESFQYSVSRDWFVSHDVMSRDTKQRRENYSILKCSIGTKFTCITCMTHSCMTHEILYKWVSFKSNMTHSWQ